jgi:hypothetical protein
MPKRRSRVTIWTGVLERRPCRLDRRRSTHTQPFAVGHDVAPQIRRRRVAMLENDCIAAAVFDIGHPLALDRRECLFSVGLCRDRHAALLISDWARGDWSPGC